MLKECITFIMFILRGSSGLQWNRIEYEIESEGIPITPPTNIRKYFAKKLRDFRDEPSIVEHDDLPLRNEP